METPSVGWQVDSSDNVKKASVGRVRGHKDVTEAIRGDKSVKEMGRTKESIHAEWPSPSYRQFRAQGDIPLTLPSDVLHGLDPTESQWNTLTQQIFIKHQPNFHVCARDRGSSDEIHIRVLLLVCPSWISRKPTYSKINKQTRPESGARGTQE